MKFTRIMVGIIFALTVYAIVQSMISAPKRESEIQNFARDCFMNHGKVEILINGVMVCNPVPMFEKVVNN